MKSRIQFAFITFGIIITMLMSSCSPKNQKDCGFVQNVYGQRISWKSKKPIAVYIHSSVPLQLRDAIRRAGAKWEQQLGRQVFEISEDSSQLRAGSRDEKNGIYFLSEWESDKSSEQGRTSVYWAGDVIQEADIRINAANFSYYDVNQNILFGSAELKKQGKAVTAGYSFEALMIHEMGHFLGLKHREEGNTVMATHLGTNVNRVQIADSDQESLSCEYN